MSVNLWLSLYAFFVLGACREKEQGGSSVREAPSGGVEERLPLSRIRLPEGFKISLFAEDIPDARSMALGAQGVVFVGNRQRGKVYALEDIDKDGVADKTYVIASGLRMPNGIATHRGDLYVAEVSRLWRYPGLAGGSSAMLSSPPQPQLVYDDYPREAHHGWKYIAFGPDNKLYVPVGAPCNICKSEDARYASITRMNPDGTAREVYAHGVRNTVGITWHPTTREMWFTDNGRDHLGDDLPPDELNRAPRKGMHFGYPYCHGRDIGDPEFGGEASCLDFEPPAYALGAHVAALGLTFYTGDMFPAGYKHQLFVAEHGSWNRSRKSGYRVMRAEIANNRVLRYEPFAEGWLDEDAQRAWGRPVDVLVMEDGSLLVSDDEADVVYRITYEGTR